MNIGIIGFGFMGGVHLAAFKRVQGATVTAVASRKRPNPNAPTTGNLAVESCGLPEDVHWHSDWRKLLLDPQIDAIDICLPTNLHKEVAVSALERGKHVLCEKPMALDLRDCDEMLESADKSGRVLMIGHVLRFAYPYRYAASFVSARGDAVKTCTMTRNTGYPQWSEWLSREESSGGAILDLLIHDIDQALMLFGDPHAVTAVNDGQIDTMRGRLRYEGGLEVRIEGGWRAPEMPFSASFQIEANDAALIFEDGKLRLNRSDEEQIVDIPEHREYVEEMRHFVECCGMNSIPEKCLPTESARAVRIANLLRASREQTGKVIFCGN
ncbi:MAG: Gfo/Idh/MocA family protein [Acidobacteriaceae bacterium]